jgi:hypothetical protein
MKINKQLIDQITSEVGEFKISYNPGGVYLRFGYWKQINFEKLKSILSDIFDVEELWDRDEDTGVVWMYEIKSKPSL